MGKQIGSTQQRGGEAKSALVFREGMLFWIVMPCSLSPLYSSRKGGKWWLLRSEVLCWDSLYQSSDVPCTIHVAKFHLSCMSLQAPSSRVRLLPRSRRH